MAVDSLSIVFLCYNEAENVVRCLEESVRVLEGLGLRRWEVLVVDDGSVDGTAALIEDYALSRPTEGSIRVARHARNRGYGEAMLTGFREARCDWVFMTDGDLQFHLEEIELLIQEAPLAPFVQGYRIGRADPRGRVALGVAYRTIVRTAFRLPVRDPECAFRLVRRNLLHFNELRCRGDLVPVEIIHRLARDGTRIAEVGVRHRAREAGESKAVSFKVFKGLAREMASLYFRAP